MRARDAGLACGSLPLGERNRIADVAGVAVGHATLAEGDIRTGVTAVLPHDGDLFRDKVVASAYVLNGFGKSIGLMQLNELGTLESPILLTNTFAVGTCSNAIDPPRHHQQPPHRSPDLNRESRRAGVQRRLPERHSGDGIHRGTCDTAIESAAKDFAVGSVGAGTGMSCFGLKGGIGTASRELHSNRQPYHLGVVVLANFGRAGDLRLPDGAADRSGVWSCQRGRLVHHCGRNRCPVGPSPAWPRCAPRWRWAGVVRLVLGQRQWRHRAGVQHRHRVPHDADRDLIDQRVLAETRIDRLFQAAAEATQEAVLDALVAAGTMIGRNGHRRIGLTELL